MKTLLISCIAAFTITAQAADIKDRPTPVQPRQDTSSVSMPVKSMNCPQCTNVTVVIRQDFIPSKPGHGLRYVTRTEHRGPGCRDTLGRKAGTKDVETVHVCKFTGEPSVCCPKRS